MSTSAARDERERLEANKRVARRYPEEVATKRNVELLGELLTEDYVEHATVGPDTRGPAEDREQMEAFIAAFPDFEARVDEIVAEGDIVAMRLTLRGTHEGEFMGLEPTGRSFEVQNMLFTRVEDGKIAERWVQPDMLGLMRQLGIETLPSE